MHFQGFTQIIWVEVFPKIPPNRLSQKFQSFSFFQRNVQRLHHFMVELFALFKNSIVFSLHCNFEMYVVHLRAVDCVKVLIGA